jgi:hypothetical protein
MMMDISTLVKQGQAKVSNHSSQCIPDLVHCIDKGPALPYSERLVRSIAQASPCFSTSHVSYATSFAMTFGYKLVLSYEYVYGPVLLEL